MEGLSSTITASINKTTLTYDFNLQFNLIFGFLLIFNLDARCCDFPKDRELKYTTFYINRIDISDFTPFNFSKIAEIEEKSAIVGWSNPKIIPQGMHRKLKSVIKKSSPRTSKLSSIFEMMNPNKNQEPI